MYHVYFVNWIIFDNCLNNNLVFSLVRFDLPSCPLSLIARLSRKQQTNKSMKSSKSSQISFRRLHSLWAASGLPLRSPCQSSASDFRHSLHPLLQDSCDTFIGL